MSVQNLVMGATFVAVMGCTIRFDWPDHHVEIAMLAERDTMQTVTIDGTELRVDSAEVSITASELVTCADDDERRRNLPGFAVLGPSLAFAHIEPTSTTDATPRVAHTLAAEDAVIGVLRPPADRYCAIALELGPLPVEGATMSETTARITGEIRRAETADWEAFEWRTGARATVRLDFEEPLELGEKSQQLRFGIRPNVVQWFELIEHDMRDEDAAYRALQSAVGAAECVR